MDEKDYELLVTLHKLKNITKTAQKLYLSQPSLTKRIQNIENELQCQLVVRSHKGIIFTPAGESLIPYATQILSSSRLMREQVASKQAEICGTLRIGVPQNFAYYHLPALLRRYTNQYPKVNVQIEISQSRKVHQMLQQDEITIAIVRGEYPWDEEMELLSTEPICLVCNQENIGRPLNQYPYICRHTDADINIKIYSWLKSRGYPDIQPSFKIDSTDICKEMVRYGLGWSILPGSRLADFDGYREELILDSQTPVIRNTYVLYRRIYTQFPQVEKFLQFLKEDSY